MNTLIEKIEQWAEDRNLIKGSTPARQIYKTMEEVTELAVAIGAWRDSPENELEEIRDAIGDVTVTLIIIAAQLGFDFEACVEGAYEEIKDRKGKMVNGVFVKEVS